MDRILYQKEKTFFTKMLLFPLFLLSLPYGWAIRAKNHFYSLGLSKPQHLLCPVISIGNITVGGTGKTPWVIALAKGLMERGIPVAVLSRGYKRGETSKSVVSDGQTVYLSLEEAGDEPFLMAKHLKGIPVLVGKDRWLNGRTALQQFGVWGLLLDDGYQYLRLYRDLNILLIDSQIGFGDGHLLPRGILREPLSGLARAHLFVLTKVGDLGQCQSIGNQLHAIHPSIPVFHSHYDPVGLVGPEGEWEDLSSVRGKKVLALSGIADPKGFSSLLKKCQLEVISELTFPDHYSYTIRDLGLIRKKARGVDWVVTTEKDMVKLQYLDITSLRIRALRIEVKIWEEEAFYKKVMELF